MIRAIFVSLSFTFTRLFNAPLIRMLIFKSYEYASEKQGRSSIVTYKSGKRDDDEEENSALTELKGDEGGTNECLDSLDDMRKHHL